ncbi:MAG: shikimate kinase [Candidatus Sericytochromatia bacterium]|nr:shikimate kinase [Candidatus Sericytochromatia bacterium]
MPPERPIALLGFPRSGKSTLGQQLAAALGWPWQDSDQLLQTQMGCAPGVYIAKHGEAAFRAAENTWLQHWQPTTPVVLSTGGGLPCAPERLSLLQHKALTIWLQLPADLLMQRLWSPPAHELTTRCSPEALTHLYHERAHFYRQAEQVLRLGTEDSASSLKRLLALLKQAQA